MQKRSFSTHFTYLFFANEGHKEICEIYIFGFITEHTCQNFLKNLSLKNVQHEVVEDKMKVIIELNCHITVQEIEKRLNVPHTHFI